MDFLKNLNEKIDIFISDSDHDPKYESKEYEIVLSKISLNGVLLADNAHASDSLFDFSIKNKGKFLWISEKKINHWYPSAGIGLSIIKNAQYPFQN